MSNNPTAQVALLALVCLVLTWVGVWALRVLAPRVGLLDFPNQRSSHQRPTARGGGLAFALVCTLAILCASRLMGIPMLPGGEALLLGASMVAAVGLADDRYGLSVRLRFGAYLAAAGVLVAGAGGLHELQWSNAAWLRIGWLGTPVVLLWVVGLTNVYNFMDGIDGIAAVQAVVASASVALLAAWQGQLELVLWAAILAGGVLGFLPHNWPPARIFMGDVGSAFLGYSFAGLALLSSATGLIPFGVWVVLLSPFLFDASLTLALRVARGERWHEAHRQHLYQRLIRRGWSHLAVTGLYLGLDLLLASIVVVGYALGIATVYLATAALPPLLGLYCLVRWVERRPPGTQVQGAVSR